ncbi:XRE family transcriptional regulator [Cryptosporangium japonicum]|uniref:XRE family transcriptional regulator n=1 Tax=Cryptosporangium japonicum TaxID=80872 RepID=A0ABN0V646_9ACTN
MTDEGAARPPSDAAHGPAAREVDEPAPADGRLERAIGAQVRRIRLASGQTLAEMAVRTGISKAMLSKIENAQTSCSLTTLARLADALDTPVTSLFRGADAEREAVYTPAGAGARIVARGTRVGHDYTLLGALRGPHKRMEAHLVTLTERSERFPLFQHPGTELLFMLEGAMVYGHGESSYRMRPGDALQLDGEGAHGPQELLELPIRFLSVVAYGDGAPDPS